MPGDPHLFIPQFTAEELPKLSCGYLHRRTRTGLLSSDADEIALQAGRKIRQGDRTKETLKQIIAWKNSDSRFWKKIERDFERNSPLEIKEALTAAVEAVEAANGTAAVTSLIRLSGVSVPTASAILTTIFPERYTVIDRLALRAFGVENREIAFYILYNAAVRTFAKANQADLRTVDRALWEWGKTHPLRRAGPARSSKGG